MKARHTMFKRQGKQWLPSFLASSPSQAKKCLLEWANEDNYPVQKEISQVLAKTENILLRVEDMNVTEITGDFAEALLLLLSALKTFMERHNADDAIRDLIVSSARVLLLSIDSLALDDVFQKLRDDSERDARSIFSTQSVTRKKKRRFSKQTQSVTTAQSSEVQSTPATSHSTSTAGGTSVNSDNHRLRRSIREASHGLKRRMVEGLSKRKKSEKSVWNVITDPELKLMYEELIPILKHLTEATISRCIFTGSYALEPLKALKNKRSSVYGGISSALENALKKPQASTLKQIALAALEIPADIIIGTGCGLHVGYLESKGRLYYMRDVLSTNRVDKHNEEDQSETYSVINKPNILTPVLLTRLQRTRSLSEFSKTNFKNAKSGQLVNLLKDINIPKAEKYDSKLYSKDSGCAYGSVRVKLKRSYSYNDAKLCERRGLISSGRGLLDEWFESRNQDEEGDDHNAVDIKNQSLHSNDDEWSFKDSIMRLKDIGGRTKVVSSIRTTLLRKGNVEYLKGNVKDILDMNTKEKILALLRKLENRSSRFIFEILAHALCSYSQASGICEERKKFVKCLKKVLQSLTSQENIELLVNDLNKVSKTSPYITLRLLMSLRRHPNTDSYTNEKETCIDDENINFVNDSNDNNPKTQGGESNVNNNTVGSVGEHPSFDNVKKASYIEQLFACVVDIIESSEGRNVIADIVDMYMSVKLESSRKMLAKAIKLFKLTSKNYKSIMPVYLIIFQILRDISSKVLPVFAKESGMLSIPVHRATNIKGFELYFLKEPKILLHDITPDKVTIALEHRTTDIEGIQKILHLENDKHVLVPDSIRNFVKFFLKISPTSVNRFQKWDIREGEKGPKWLVNMSLKGMHFVLNSEEVALLATNRHKGTLGNFTYNVIHVFRKMGRKKRKSIQDDRGKVNFQSTLAQNREKTLSDCREYLTDEENVYFFDEKKSYTVWKGNVAGMVYGKGVTVSVMFETVPPNEDVMPNANQLAKKLHRKLSHSEAIMDDDMVKLMRPKSRKMANSSKESHNSKHNNTRFSNTRERISRVIHSNSESNGESFRLAAINVNVPYYSSRLRVRGIMGSVLSLSAESKIRSLIKEGIEDYIIKSLSIFNFERTQALV